ncbi:MAG TPA: MMPL family transporter [Acidimicrobiales bacterium]|nr:MMPL family transporter [Acidimicrobiales bacterium]
MIGFICGKRTKWVVLVVWVVILGLAGGVANKLMSVEKNDAISFLPPNAQSTQVQNLAGRFTGGKTQLATVVYHRPGGLTPEDLATIASDRSRIDATPDRAAGQEPAQATVISTDRATAYFSVPLSSAADINQTTDAVNHVRAVVGEGSGGLDVKVTGQAASLVDAVGAFKGLDTTLLLAAGVLVAVLLLIIYRSPFLWLLPLLAVGFAYQAAEALIYELARHGLTVNGQSAGILTILIFGVGTDYALLIVARYREELVRHEDRHEAMAAALRRAGPTILASGGTVTLSLLCLLTASLNSDRGLGPVCAIGVVVVVIAMLTALPMLLLILGRGVFWPFVPHFDPSVEAGHEVVQKRLWVWLGRLITARARTIWILSALLLGVMALGLFHLDTNLTNAEGFTGTVDSVAGQTLIEQGFPSGTTAPLLIIVPADRAAEAARIAASVKGIATVTPPQISGGLAQVVAIGTAADSTPAADATVNDLRAQLAATIGPDALVGGPSAVDLDVRKATVHDEKVVIPLVLAVVLLVLMILLRAVLGPILLVLTVLASYLASLGVAAVANTTVFGFAATSPALPLFGFIFLVALGCDYNIFLMARVREEAIEYGTREGTRRGLSATGGVITSAGLILAGTFAVLGILPLVALAEIGFIVAFGVLLDTFVVRSVLVPALVMDVGPAWWWPSALWEQGRSAPAVEEPTHEVTPA